MITVIPTIIKVNEESWFETRAYIIKENGETTKLNIGIPRFGDVSFDQLQIDAIYLLTSTLEVLCGPNNDFCFIVRHESIWESIKDHVLGILPYSDYALDPSMNTVWLGPHVAISK